MSAADYRRHPGVMLVECPKCGAKAMQRCLSIPKVGKIPGRLHSERPHKERINAIGTNREKEE